jgi:hypothetical protein
MEKAPEYKKLKNKKVEDKQSNNFGNLITIQLKKTEKKITNQTDSDKNSGETKPNS